MPLGTKCLQQSYISGAVFAETVVIATGQGGGVKPVPQDGIHKRLRGQRPHGGKILLNQLGDILLFQQTAALLVGAELPVRRLGGDGAGAKGVDGAVSIAGLQGGGDDRPMTGMQPVKHPQRHAAGGGCG